MGAADGTFKLGYDLSQLEADGHRAALVAKQHGAKIAKEHAAAAAKSRDAFKAMGSEMIAMAGIPLGIGAAVLGLKSMAERFDQIEDTAGAMNASVEGVQRLQFIAAGTVTPFEQMSGGLIKIKRALFDVDSESKQRALARMGLDAQGFMALDADQAFIKLARGFQSAQDKGEGFSEMFELVKKSAPELMGALRISADDLERMGDKAVISAATIRMFTENLGKAKMTGMEWTNNLASFMKGAADVSSDVGAGIAGMFTGEGFWKAGVGHEKEREAAEKAAAEKAAADRKRIAEKEIEQAEKLKKYKEDDRNESRDNATQSLAFAEWDSASKLAIVKGEIYDLDQRIAGETGRMIEDADYRFKQEMKLNALKKEQIGLQKAARKEAESTASMLEDIAILEMKAHHRSKSSIDKKEKEAKLQKDFQQIRDAHPDLSPEQAMNLAKRKADAQDRIDNPSLIRGFKGVTGGSGAYDPKSFSGLDAMKARNAIPWDKLHPGPGLIRTEKTQEHKKGELTAQERQIKILERIEVLLDGK